MFLCNEENDRDILQPSQISTHLPHFTADLHVGTEVMWLNRNSFFETALSPEGENRDMKGPSRPVAMILPFRDKRMSRLILGDHTPFSCLPTKICPNKVGLFSLSIMLPFKSSEIDLYQPILTIPGLIFCFLSSTKTWLPSNLSFDPKTSFPYKPVSGHQSNQGGSDLTSLRLGTNQQGPLL